MHSILNGFVTWFQINDQLLFIFVVQALKRLYFKGALSGLKQFLTAESPLKMMKNAFYFTSKAFFVLKMIKFLSWLFGHVAKTTW